MRSKGKNRNQLVPKYLALIAVILVSGCGGTPPSDRSTPTAPQETSTPTISPDTATNSGHIIYSKTNDHSWWSIEPDGGNPRQIDIPPDAYAVQSNPDRTLVFFTSRDTFVVNLDQGDVRSMDLPLSLDSWVWSPNGQEAIWGDYMNPSAVLENFTTGETIKFMDGRRFDMSRFSPDGKWIAYHSKEGIYLVDPDRQDQRLVADGGTIVGFTPESDQFIYTYGDDTTEALYIENLDGSNRRELLRAERLYGLGVLPDKGVVLVGNFNGPIYIQAIELDTGSQIWASSDSQLQGRRMKGLSPNGKLLILNNTPMEEYPTYYVIDVASGDKACVIDPRERTGHDIEFSADGWHASLTAASSAFVVDFKTCQLMRLVTPQETADTSDEYQTGLVGYTEWAPQATQLLIVVGEPGKEMELFFYDSNRNNVQGLASGLEIISTFSPNGEKIAFSITTEGENQERKNSIYLMDVDLLDATPFLDDAALWAWVR